MAVEMRKLVEHIPLELLIHKHVRPYLTGDDPLTTEDIVKLTHGICNTKDNSNNTKDGHVQDFTPWSLLITDAHLDDGVIEDLESDIESIKNVENYIGKG